MLNFGIRAAALVSPHLPELCLRLFGDVALQERELGPRVHSLWVRHGAAAATVVASGYREVHSSTCSTVYFKLKRL